jgi:flavin-binding protein dodecin
MSVLKVIEIMANSTESWEDATKKAVKHAAKSVKGIKSVFVQSQSAVVDADHITEFRVNLKITFEVKD